MGKDSVKCVTVWTYNYSNSADFKSDVKFLKDKHKYYTYSSVGDKAIFWGVSDDINQEDMPNNMFDVEYLDPYKYIGFGLSLKIIEEKIV